MKNSERKNMQRSSIFLTRQQVAGVAKAAGEEGLYPAQITRVAVSDWLARRTKQRAANAPTSVKHRVG